MSRVLVTDTIFPDLSIEKEVFANTDIEICQSNARTPEEIVQAGQDLIPEALLTATHVRIDSTVFEALSDLRLVSSYGIGVDHIALDAATEHNVWVSNVPDYCVEEVSTHTVALILSIERSVCNYSTHVQARGWEWSSERPIDRLFGKTLGIVGLGRIGSRVAEKMIGFGVDVIACDPNLSSNEMAEMGVEKQDFDTLLARSDIVSVHVPLTGNTEHLFDMKAFKAMKESAVFINTCRGGVVNEIDLSNAIHSGEIRSAGLDVLEQEPPTDISVLNNDRILLTPHVAWYSEDAIEALQRKAAEEVRRVLEGEHPHNIVNPDVESRQIADD